ncbi:hypothetical protein [Mesorhizobium sp. B2-7-3]|uniref:hypothetical protein n=1 Tax=Mesorhizobium sp. B2-7-3 TaxID=2589907 RepID=UPI0015E47474|nr:hypothetical protein [Mesorhizobium sp. B2-7-3]
MPDGGRHDYVTFGWIATIIGLLLFGALGQSYTTSKHQSSYYAQRCAQQYPDSPFAAASVHPFTGKPEAQPPDNGQNAQPDWCDLAAQQSVAEDTTGMHWASWAGVVFTVIGIFFIWRTLNANTAAVEQARTANDIAGRSNEAQLRAYLAVQSIEIIQTGSEWMPNIRIKFKNFGQTPAYDLTNICDYDFQDRKSGRKPRRQVRGARLLVGKMDLAPTQDMTSTLLISMGEWARRKPMLELNKNREIETDLYVFGKLHYRDAFSNKPNRWTEYRFRLDVDEDGVIDGEGFHLTQEGNESN